MNKNYLSEKILSGLVTHHLKLLFFDLEANIKSDSSDFITLFTKMYRRFLVDKSPSLSDQKSAEFVLLTKPDNRWGKPVMILDGEVLPLSDPRLLEGFAYESILSAIVTRVRSHLLIHAGVISYNGQGVILVADARHGKTTLVLELIRRGCNFLSDEMAALGRTDHLVHPFPRSLRVRPGTLELVGFPEAVEGAPAWLGKLLLDIEEIKPDCLGMAVPINHIIILQEQTDDNEKLPDCREQELNVLVDRLDETLLSAINQIETVIDVHADIDRGYPLIKLHATRTTFVLSQIEALCRERQILVLDVIKGVESHPTFELPAQLKFLSRRQAVMELLRRFQGGYKSELLQNEFGGSSTRLFMELSTLVSHADCHQLFVGPLNEMADFVCNLVGT